MQIASRILACLAALSATLIFVAALDIGHLGLKEMLGVFAIAPVAVFLIGSIAHIFVGGASATPAESEEDLSEKIDEVRTKLGTRISSLQGAVDSFSGQDKEALLEENAQLKEQLAAIEQADRERAEHQAQSLKERNEMLEEQIKKWAISQVDKVVSDKQQAA